MKSLFDRIVINNNPLVTKLTNEQIECASDMWGKYLVSDHFILTSNNVLSGISAVGLIYGVNLLNILGNSVILEELHEPIMDHTLYKIILYGTVDYAYDNDSNNFGYCNNYGDPITFSYYYPKKFNIKIKTLIPIQSKHEEEAIENFKYNRELFLLYRDQLSPSLCNKLAHGPENDHTLDENTRLEILMLNEKLVENVKRKTK
jgi:hypothetical protein